MMRHIVSVALLVGLLGPATARAAGSDPAEAAGPDTRLMIVNGNSGRVVYDDGHDDLFCVTRKVIVGYDEDGDPIRRRRMHCR